MAEPQNPLTAQGGGKRKEKRFRKREDLYYLLDRIRLYPSSDGVLHGVRSVKLRGNVLLIVTHCNQQVSMNCSRRSRLARWLRNKWYEKPCQGCRVPEWKLEKYSQTSFVKEGGRGHYFLAHPKAASRRTGC